MVDAGGMMSRRSEHERRSPAERRRANWSALATSARSSGGLLSLVRHFNHSGVDLGSYRDEVLRRLALADSEVWTPHQPHPADRLVAEPVETYLTCGAFSTVTIELHNAGPVPWQDRLLWRVGAPGASALATTPGLLPLPNTVPGGRCSIVVPIKAQWYGGRCAITYVPVFPSGELCTPHQRDGVRITVEARPADGMDVTYPVTARLARALARRLLNRS